MCVRCGEMAAEVERLQSVIDEANVRVWAEAARVLENSDAPKAAQFWRQGVVNLFRNRAATAAHPIPAQQSPAAAIPEESVTVSIDELKRIHRDLDACQKVIGLAGGFDPAYCTDAQESLLLLNAMLSASPKENT